MAFHDPSNEKAEATVLKHDPLKNQGSEPISGPELEFLPVNFKIGAEDILLGYAGVPAFIRRSRILEDLLEAFWRRAEAEYTRIREETLDPATFASRWRVAAGQLDFKTIEEHVADFNRYFPTEANLPMDPATGDFVYRGERFEPKVAPTLPDVLNRFPV